MVHSEDFFCKLTQIVNLVKILLSTEDSIIKTDVLLRGKIWFGCAAGASKPLPISKRHFCWKKVPISKDFSRNIGQFFTFFGYSLKMFGWWTPQNTQNVEEFGETDPCLRGFPLKSRPISKDFLWKNDPLEQLIPVWPLYVSYPLPLGVLLLRTAIIKIVCYQVKISNINT